jgi:hypothetical protein
VIYIEPTQGAIVCDNSLAEDTFDSGTFGTEWDEGCFTNVNCAWSIDTTGGNLLWESNGNQCKNDIDCSWSQDEVAGEDDVWGCMTFVSAVSTPSSPGMAFHGSDINESASWLQVYATLGTQNGHADQGPSGFTTFTCTGGLSESMDATDEFCARITDNGATYNVDMWVNPPAGEPGNGMGAADCSVTPTDWTKDTGTFIGVRFFSGASTTDGEIRFDLTRGGFCS